MDVNVTRIINAPRDAVRDYLADARNDTAWRKNTKSSELTSGTPGTAGAQFEQVVMAMGNPTTVAVTLLEASDEQLKFRGDGGMMPVEVTFDTKSVDAGTELSLTISLDIPPAMAKMATRMIEADNNSDLDQLAEILES